MSENTEMCKETEKTMGILAGKWKPVILFHLLYGGTKRFNELKRLIPTVTQKMLTNQLRELEQQDIIKRIVYAQVPPKVEYLMTDYGRSLQPLIEIMYEWGASHIKHMENKEKDLTVDEKSVTNSD
ncbi:transcriptional regulator, HxlR family [Gracilibacillus orientalis]|uniref:Transcriptional regulator, HxlR family n=1 Tax=Gracilibacillus orientalis TaxID=334253 RepID=A0A1I4NFK5_9BACI|nr:winged helix-turn-helix transcriptional regulator [Gracilibacillus orientalis]SFM14281.1 transcriptional regulator, HxlR family [Gracilibacillus orientalis]